MTVENRIPIEKPQGHLCFACGTANPIGLNMEFYRDGDGVCSDISIGEYYQGWENMAHGGIISALLDEIMAWSIFYFKKALFVTRKMDIKYIRPVPTGIPLKAIGRIKDDSESPKIRTVGEIRDRDGRLYVRSRGEFVLMPEEKLEAVPQNAKQEMLDLFRRFR